MNKLLTPKQVAEILQISLPQLCRLTRAGRIPAKDLGFGGKNHSWRYDEEKLQEWIRQEPEKEGPPRRRRSRLSVVAEPFKKSS